MTDEERQAAEAAAAEEARKAAEAAAAEEARKAKEAEDAKKKAAADAAGDANVAAELEQLRKEAEEARKEADEAKKQAARFKGIDPEVAKENAKKVAEAEEAKREAERKQAEAEGNFERLRELQNEDFERKLKEIEEQRDAARAEAEAIKDRLSSTTRKSAFAASKFFADETVLTAAKAERLFGDFVEVEDGVVVVYDAPAGSSKRAKIMDAKGVPLPFDTAIQKVFEKDPDHETLAKSKVKPGAGSKSEDAGNPQAKASSDRISRLANAVAQLRK
ncbi:DUF6651 domain-containing protein [Novosphingobium sp. NPDC080210]|uniref:DUF6651 domain-containing protein n=1 Tax=Novosphingobium sp. NPDC080210 TaxID=3390596 RepID=UPI003D0304B7